MGIDTIAKIRGRVTPKQIVDTIKELFDVDVKNEVVRHKYEKLNDLDFPFRNYGDEDYWFSDFGSIVFTYNGENRMLFYSYDNINVYENIKYYKEKCPDRTDIHKMIKSEKTHLSLGNWGSSVEILENIVKKFGGWIDDNDCDDIPYRYIEKED